MHLPAGSGDGAHHGARFRRKMAGHLVRPVAGHLVRPVAEHRHRMQLRVESCGAAARRQRQQRALRHTWFGGGTQHQHQDEVVHAFCMGYQAWSLGHGRVEPAGSASVHQHAHRVLSADRAPSQQRPGTWSAAGHPVNSSTAPPVSSSRAPPVSSSKAPGQQQPGTPGLQRPTCIFRQEIMLSTASCVELAGGGSSGVRVATKYEQISLRGASMGRNILDAMHSVVSSSSPIGNSLQE